MSLSPFDSFQLRFVTYLLNFPRTCVITSRSVLIRMRNLSDKIVQKIKTHILCTTFVPKIVPLMCKNVLQPDSPQLTI